MRNFSSSRPCRIDARNESRIASRLISRMNSFLAPLTGSHLGRIARQWTGGALLALCGHALASPAPEPYTLPGTEVLTLHADKLKRDYEICISLPASYGQTQKTYPVVFLTDTNYAFPIVRGISQFLSRHDANLQEFILVGLGYAKGDKPVLSRNRDYTPAAPKTGNRPQPGEGEGVYGEAEAYRQFVAAQVLPLIAKNYRADMHRKVFMGHSYGALFGTHVLLTEPAMFQHYILGSPSLWFGKHTTFEVETARAASKKDIPAKVFMMTGEFETIKPGSKDPRYNRADDLVQDMLSFEKQLKAHRYPGLSVQSRVIAGENHNTVFPVIATHGLLWALPERTAVAPKPVAKIATRTAAQAPASGLRQ